MCIKQGLKIGLKCFNQFNNTTLPKTFLFKVSLFTISILPTYLFSAPFGCSGNNLQINRFFVVNKYAGLLIFVYSIYWFTRVCLLSNV